jgi:hypothetical protein
MTATSEEESVLSKCKKSYVISDVVCSVKVYFKEEDGIYH